MQDLIVYLLAPASQVALIIGIAEVLKRVGLNTKYIPLFDVLLGLIFGIFVDGVALGYGAAIGSVVGIACGLSACGLFSGIKNLAEEVKEEKEKHKEE